MNIMGRYVLRLVGIGAVAIATPHLASAFRARRCVQARDGTDERRAKESKSADNT
jgi:hypothetical protein